MSTAPRSQGYLRKIMKEKRKSENFDIFYIIDPSVGLIGLIEFGQSAVTNGSCDVGKSFKFGFRANRKSI
jgi:Mg/Co/Ni transporter MgtE